MSDEATLLPSPTTAPLLLSAPSGSTMLRARHISNRWRPSLPIVNMVSLGRLRGKLRYRPVVFELLPPTFTLLQLQLMVEALAGVRLHKQNFRRLVENAICWVAGRD